MRHAFNPFQFVVIAVAGCMNQKQQHAIDYLKLALIHPSGNSDQYKPERIERFRHPVASLSADTNAGVRQRIFNTIRFSGFTAFTTP